MTERDQQRLVGVHPQLRVAIQAVFLQLNVTPLFVVEGVRTTAQQQALWAKGRTLPGPIVTYKDGVIHRSNHQVHQDGLGHAIDCAFIGATPFAETWPWEAYGLALETQGLVWGGRWKMLDRPHAELPD